MRDLRPRRNDISLAIVTKASSPDHDRSMVVAFYNEADLMPATLVSLAAQTFRPWLHTGKRALQNRDCHVIETFPVYRVNAHEGRGVWQRMAGIFVQAESGPSGSGSGLASAETVPASGQPDLGRGAGRTTIILFITLLIGGLVFGGFSLTQDIAGSQVPVIATTAVVLLGLALFTALAFEFVNGFHDTANAVATVIYTHAMSPLIAVLWSGLWNFLGVLLASGAVAFGIISLLPVELILQSDVAAGFAMVFAILVAAIVWNLATWAVGLPSSSSHTLIGSIIGVGVANQLMNAASGASGVEWGKAKEIGLSLLISPLLGFAAAGALLLAMKLLIKAPALYKEPEGIKPPPLLIRGLLILTCTLVSFFHGSNDGQKGMGLIMLILIGTVPTAYALNPDLSAKTIAGFEQNAIRAEQVLIDLSKGGTTPADPRAEVKRFLQTRATSPEFLPALAALSHEIGTGVAHHGSLSQVPTADVAAMRADLYMASESLRLLDKQADFKPDGAGKATLKAFKSDVDRSVRFIPLWVKVVIAIALGLGTIVGWKRIVITVGEKIGKARLTYAQGAAAGLVAAGTIGAADALGLPVSTTHVLSSGIAGTMAANGSGLQMATIRNLLLAWVLTLPVSILLSGVLYYVFMKFV
jgi:PiT family inorganic phosphate transporter